MARKPTDTVHLRLRFDERLRRRIEKAAEQNAQSMNAEIVARLEHSFQQEDIKANVLNPLREALADYSRALDAKFDRLKQDLKRKEEK